MTSTQSYRAHRQYQEHISPPDDSGQAILTYSSQLPDGRTVKTTFTVQEKHIIRYRSRPLLIADNWRDMLDQHFRSVMQQAAESFASTHDATGYDNDQGWVR